MSRKINRNSGRSDKSDSQKSHVTFDPSLLSLSERVRAVLGAERVEELAGLADLLPAHTEAAVPYDRTGRRGDFDQPAMPVRGGGEPLETGREGPARRRELPDRWTFVHVADRMEEAVEVLGRLPDASRPKSYGNAMPQYTHDWADRLAQVDSGEFERTLDERNRFRRGATPGEISRMMQALHWPMDYLADQPEIATVLGLAALWAVVKADVPKRCRAIGMTPRTFLLMRMRGLEIITKELIRRRVPVS